LQRGLDGRTRFNPTADPPAIFATAQPKVAVSRDGDLRLNINMDANVLRLTRYAVQLIVVEQGKTVLICCPDRVSSTSLEDHRRTLRRTEPIRSFLRL